ncbi:tetratricopeptide repeat (TPR)-like superfamily protein [Actinidia rufa]|uniref:Tetratricopeptide repeat (TPR)-like superfamily protein n=1 Tax=Actinidia rufa TaxID=165716 RepID=A0A7J0FKT3_9ERIC|nr:tetratricopeptide repeat (TPR)-like superfamily protein [Actinidia rufa]
MAIHSPKIVVSLLFLVFTVTCATARILDEDVPEVPAIAPEAPDLPETPISPVTPVATAPPATTGAAVATATPDHTLTFFMHDILGGSNPTSRAMTGIVTNPGINGQVPFAKPNGAVLPVNNGVPLNNANSGVINNNNIPFLSGLGGTTPNLIQSNGNNNFINGGFGFPAEPNQFWLSTTPKYVREVVPVIRRRLASSFFGVASDICWFLGGGITILSHSEHMGALRVMGKIVSVKCYWGALPTVEAMTLPQLLVITMS